eukprot:g163.t1
MDALGNYDPVPGCSTYCTSMTRPVCDANRTLQITTLKPCQTKLKNVCGKGNATLSFFLNGNLYKCQGNAIDKNAKTNLTDEICDYDMESDLMHDLEVQLEYGALSAFAVVTIGLTIIFIFLRLLPSATPGVKGGESKNRDRENHFFSRNWKAQLFDCFKVDNWKPQYHQYESLSYGIQLPLVVAVHENFGPTFSSANPNLLVEVPYEPSQPDSNNNNKQDVDWEKEEILNTITNHGEEKTYFQILNPTIEDHKHILLKVIEVVSEEVRQDPQIEKRLDDFFFKGEYMEPPENSLTNYKSYKPERVTTDEKHFKKVPKEEISEVDFIEWFLNEHARVFEKLQSRNWAGIQLKVQGLIAKMKKKVEEIFFDPIDN